ncbi:Dihydroorotate dehydrogenase (quinone), mitochondrial [Basidiobolus ranarum]|uniref:Dihydroorotate dehydrogenase (quinone), mitochondrial n=1 Tax=Basidiobolus ranarum TaxID=34480 RepID=A0ABR2WPK0_9FUNG
MSSRTILCALSRSRVSTTPLFTRVGLSQTQAIRPFSLASSPVRPLNRAKFSPTSLSSYATFSTTTTVSSPLHSVKSFLVGSLAVGGALFLSVYLLDSRAGFHKYVLMPIMHQFDPEAGHRVAIVTGKYGLSPRDRVKDADNLEVELWGKKFSNPLGLAAGFDKHGEAIDSMFDMGFGFVEVGSVTPEPQPGNPKPRLFRLKEDKGVINRYGFNSDGHKAVVDRLKDRLRHYFFHHPNAESTSINQSLRPDKQLGLNLGKNKTSSPESFSDYIQGIETLGRYADYLVVNISSPNTPGLRSLQRRDMLEGLVKQVMIARDSLPEPRPPLLIKIAPCPDLSHEELCDIAQVALDCKVDGVIVSNTTINRPSGIKSDSKILKEAGGLSGGPLFPQSLATVREFYKLTKGQIPIIGAGGIRSGKDAVAFAKAGASMVQIYSILSYDGPGAPRAIKDEIVQELNGQKWKDIVGIENKL